MTTILVVDDVPSEKQLISSYLMESGHKVVSADSAKTALEEIKKQIPDVIVTDVVMPDMNGFEFCRKVKKDETTKNIPIVICSSKNQELDKLWGMKQGADVYVTKPFTKEDLTKAIKSVI